MKYVIAFAFSFLAGTAFAQDTLNFAPPATPVAVYATRAKEAISVDGKLSE